MSVTGWIGPEYTATKNLVPYSLHSVRLLY